MKKGNLQVFYLLIALCLSFMMGTGNKAWAQATVQTDQSDYLPGDIVIITGDGWLADEPVTLNIQHVYYTSHPDETWTTTAGPTGYIFDNSYIIDPWDLGETFLLTATGQNSGYVATASFTDGDFLGTIEIGMQTGYFLLGETGSVTFPIYVTRDDNAGNGNFDVRVCITENFPDYFTYAFSEQSYQPDQGIIHFNTGQDEAEGTMTIYYDGDPSADPTAIWTFSIMGYVLPNNQNNNFSCSNPTSDNATGTFEGELTFGQPPSITCPGNISVNNDAGYCSAVVNYSEDVIFSGDPTPTITYAFTGATTASGNGTGSGATFAKGVTNVTLTATNGIEPDATCSFTVTVEDNEAPTFTAPGNTTIYTTANCSYDASVSVTGDVTNEADNCSTGLQATFVDVVTDGSCEGSKTITRTWSLVDNDNNAAANQVQTITVLDNIPPTFTRPADITIYTDATCNYDASVTATGDVSDEADNCSTGLNATYSDVIVDGSCQGSHVITRTWSLVDDCGNAAANQVQTITVSDNTPPTFTRPADITIYTDATCNYDASVTVTGDVTDEADNCSTGLQATYVDSDPVSGGCEAYLIITRTWSLVDDCGNEAEDQVQTIKVMIPATIETFTSAVQARYYDDITLYAEIANNCENDDMTGTVEFFLNDVSVGIANAYPIPTGEEGSEDNMLRATLLHKLVEMPGSYAVKAVFTPSCGKYTSPQDLADQNLIVLAREASPLAGSGGFYTGPLYSWTTGPNSSTATITLSAVIQDNNDPTGDVRGALVTFYYFDNGNLTPIPSAQNLPVGLIDQTDGTVGAANAIVQFNIGNWNALDFDITVGISGGYTNDPFAPESRVLITVSKPLLGGYIFGGGQLENTDATNGLIKGAMEPEYNTEYSFDVKYNKKGTNPQGDATIKIYSWYDANGLLDDHIHTYHVKSNAIAVLAVNKPKEPNAYFSAKATIKEELENGVMVSLEGNNTLQIWMTDPGNNGDSWNPENPVEHSTLGIQLDRKNGGIWFSSNWTGTKTIEQQILTGSELKVAPANATQSAIIDVIDPETGAEQSLTVYPNPTNGITTFRFVSANDGRASLELYNINGSRIETLLQSEVSAGQTYEVTYTPVNSQAGVILYRLIIGDEVINGKLIIQH